MIRNRTVFGLKTLPIGASRFPAPKQGATDLPLSKILGNPSTVLRASETFPPASVVSPLKDLGPKPAPVFARSLETVPVVSPAQANLRLEARRILEQKDRIIRARAGRVLRLDYSKPTGMDWIKFGRRVRPSLPGGVNGLIMPTATASVRGTSADALRVPEGTVQNLAVKGIISDANGPASLSPAVMKGFVSPKKELPPPAPTVEQISTEDAPAALAGVPIGALAILGVLVFVVMRKG